MDRRQALKAVGGLFLTVRPSPQDGRRFGERDARQEREIVTRGRSEPGARAEVRVERGGPRLFVNGREESPFFAVSTNLLATARSYRESGIRFFQPLLGLDDGWTGPGRYDWSAILAYLDKLLAAVPDALFLPRLHLFTPEWWKDLWPSELVGYALPVGPEGPRAAPQRLDSGFDWSGMAETRVPSFASARWREDMADALKSFLRAVERSPLRSRVIGYQLAGGLNGEWHHPGSAFLPDVSAPMLRETGPSPSVEERLRTSAGLLRDPSREARTIRFYERYHRRIADTALFFCRVAKTETRGHLLAGLFYAYLLENVMIQEAGHLAPERVLADPSVDFIACPYSYQHTTDLRGRARWESDVFDEAGNWLGRARGVAGDGGLRVLAESLRRHGKLFLNEMDSSTYLEPRRSTEGGSGNDTVEGTLRILRRDLAQMATCGIGGWLFDFGHLDPPYKAGRGWYDDKPLIEEIGRWAALARRRSELDISSVAEIAAVYDASSFAATRHWKAEEPWEGYGVSIMDFFNHWFCTSQARALHRMGAPVDFLYPFDLRPEDARRYRLIIVPNLFRMDPVGVRRWRGLLRGSGTTVLWLYAPGYVSPGRFDLGQMEGLTGFRFKVLAEPGPMTIRVLDERLRTGVGAFGVRTSYSPRFAILKDDVGVLPLGLWADRDEVAMGLREIDGWTSVYAGSGPLPAELLRRLAESAGARLWSSRPDVVRATKDAAMIIATSPGERTLRLAEPLAPAFGGAASVEHRLAMDFGDVLAFFRGPGPWPSTKS